MSLGLAGTTAVTAHRVAHSGLSHLHTESHPTVEEQLTDLIIQRTGKNILGNPQIIGLKVVGNQREGFDIVGFIPSEYRQPYYLKQLASETLMQHFGRKVSVDISDLKVLPIKQIESEFGVNLENYFPVIREVG